MSLVSGKRFWAKPPPPKKGEVNYALLDRFTLAHLAIGISYGAMQLQFGVALALAVAWELLENPMKVHLSFLFPHATADTLRNIIGDIGAVIFGWLIYRYLWG